jgi:hypothetical protein
MLWWQGPTYHVISFFVPNNLSFAPCFGLVWAPVIVVIIISIIIKFANLRNHVYKGEGHPMTWHWWHRGGSRGTAVPMLNLGAFGGGWSTPRPGRFTHGKEIRYPIKHEAGWVSGPAWAGAENFDPTGVQTPNRPACSKSLYRLRYAIPQPCI